MADPTTDVQNSGQGRGGSTGTSGIDRAIALANAGAPYNPANPQGKRDADMDYEGPRDYEGPPGLTGPEHSVLPPSVLNYQAPANPNIQNSGEGRGAGR